MILQPIFKVEWNNFSPDQLLLFVNSALNMNQFNLSIMKRNLTGLAAALMALLLLAGCDSDNNALLTDGIWNFRNMTTNSDDPNIQQLIALGKAFMTDATLEFQSDGTYIINTPLSQDPITGTWELVGDDQLIIDADDQPPSTANIETLSKDELKYIETFVDDQMNSYSVTTTWKR
jgi:hypothetical protein